MMDVQLIGQMLVQEYRHAPCSLHPLAIYHDRQGNPLSLTCRVEAERPADVWVLQAYQEEYAAASLFAWASDRQLAPWLQQRAALLTYLEQRDYPAPRVIPTRSGAPLGQRQGWIALASTYIDGVENDSTLHALRLLGTALGRLHRLEVQGNIPGSWWNRRTTIPCALDRLQSVGAMVPPSHRDLYECCLHSFRSVLLHQDLPQAIIHGDCWSPNARRTAEDTLVLIDWEYAGTGAAILDLGGLLLMGQCDQLGDIPAQMDGDRIAAIVQGYSQWRIPDTEELAFLAEAIRFSILWRGAWAFSRLHTEGCYPSLDRLLARVERGQSAAARLASQARTAFERAAHGR